MCMYAATDLYCDASGGSIGAVLQQTDRDGNVRPVGFYSRKLTPEEGCYGTYDREKREELDELRETGVTADRSLKQAFGDIARSY